MRTHFPHILERCFVRFFRNPIEPLNCSTSSVTSASVRCSVLRGFPCSSPYTPTRGLPGSCGAWAFRSSVSSRRAPGKIETRPISWESAFVVLGDPQALPRHRASWRSGVGRISVWQLEARLIDLADDIVVGYHDSLFDGDLQLSWRIFSEGYCQERLNNCGCAQ